MSFFKIAALALSVACFSASTQAEAQNDASRIGRTSVPKAPRFQELYDFDASAKTLSEATFPYEVRVHRAHVIMLREQKIISNKQASEILSGLEKVDAMAEKESSLKSYLPYEAALIKTIGPVAGRMHTGRSRNDLANTVNRMYYRDQVNRIIKAIITFRQTLIEKASENKDTVMVVYTHRKEAQPITLGHYYMALSENFGKAVDRYQELYKRLNLSPLGAAASAGTGWPLNRDRTSELLGFDGLVVNTIEGTAGWDHIAEFAANNAIYLSAVSRMASEIQLWTTDEYRSAELDPAYAGISSIMPQKKNPDSIERSRAISSNSVGALTSILTSMNSIEYQHSVARVALEPRSIDALIAATHAMTGVVETLHPDKSQMLKYASQNYSTMTDVADVIVRESGIDFREAHEVVAGVVTSALNKGLTADQISLQLIQDVATQRLGHPLKLTESALREALDPLRNVERRKLKGGPAPEAVQAMIDHARSQVTEEIIQLNERTKKLDESARMLNELLKS